MLDVSRFSQHLSYIQNFDQLSVIPVPHLNLQSFIGMGAKQDYLIWRQS